MKSFNIFEDASFEYDEEDPDGYRTGYHRIGPVLDGQRIGATVYEILPGQALCPYHWETEEEWLLVLSGEVTLRHPEGEDVLKAGDVVAFPDNPSGAHKTFNQGTEPTPTRTRCCCSPRARRAAGTSSAPRSTTTSARPEGLEPRRDLRV
jgi:uncharacterized cupin superfamily protein